VSRAFKNIKLHAGERLELSGEETEGWGKLDTMDSALQFAFFIYRWTGHKACLEKMRRPT